MATNVILVPPAPPWAGFPLFGPVSKSIYSVAEKGVIRYWIWWNFLKLGKEQSLHSLGKLKFLMAVNKISVKCIYIHIYIKEMKHSNRCMEQQVCLPCKQLKRQENGYFFSSWLSVKGCMSLFPLLGSHKGLVWTLYLIKFFIQFFMLYYHHSILKPCIKTRIKGYWRKAKSTIKFASLPKKKLTFL